MQELSSPSPQAEQQPPAGASLRRALEACRRHLLSLQQTDGHWCGELEGDSILESEYFLTLYFLEGGINARMRKAAERLRREQLPDGGWAIYPGGPSEVSASVKAYFVLKLVGDDARAPHLSRARRAILELGGLEACNSFTKIYLAIFGQYPWSRCPVVPPELVLLPPWAPFSIYRMSSWTRAIVVPLSVIRAAEPRCPVPDHAGIAELRDGAAPRHPDADRPPRARAWRVLFRALDWSLARLGRVPVKPLRSRALARCEQWILERLRDSDGLAAIFPPIINTLIAFRCLGYPVDHPVLRQQRAELENLVIEEEDSLRVQPCLSPVWDTALAVHALALSGVPQDDPALLQAARWLLEHEARGRADAAALVRELPPGGWYFEYANEPYPDTDDTAEVLLALSHVRFPDPGEEARRRAAIARGLAWQLAMQNGDGGWGAFDRGCDDEVLTHVPFADHNAMIDPSCEDISGRTLEALCRLGAVRRGDAGKLAVAFLLRTQRPEGTWYGRWGVNYLYGSWLALRGLKAAGIDLRARRFTRLRDWLLERQNDDGGWGELPCSYDDPSTAGTGPSTASQTAWALLALAALDELDSPAADRAVDYLLGTQAADGSWSDAAWTGTGFPRVFYLRYQLYAVYFPLWALAEVERAHAHAARPAASNVRVFPRRANA